MNKTLLATCITAGLALSLTSACPLWERPSYGRACQEDQDCAEGYVCRDAVDLGKRCQAAGSLDAGSPDAVATDSASRDLPSSDAQAEDAALPDQGLADQDLSDQRPVDVVQTDLAQADADRADHAISDSALADAGAEDSTTIALPDAAYVGDAGWSSAVPTQVLSLEADAGLGDANREDDFGATLVFHHDPSDGSDRLLVGAPYQDKGYVQVFLYAGSRWETERFFPAGADLEIAADFGASIAAQGDKIAVGAPRDGPCGSVSTYRLSAGVFQEGQRFQPVQSECGESVSGFAGTLAIRPDGQQLAVGFDTYNYNEARNGYDGQVQFYDWDGSEWVKGQTLDPPVDYRGGWFGASLAFSADGGWLLVGAPHLFLSGVGVSVGGALMFKKNAPENWGFVRPLLISEPAIADETGSAVAWRDKEAIVGTPGNNFDRGQLTGFFGQATATGQEIIATGGFPGRRLGGRISLSADGVFMASGAQWDDSPENPWPVDLYFYQGSGASWTKLLTIQAPADVQVIDDFASAVALSQDGRFLAVGAPHRNIMTTAPGRVFVYQR